jgi:hypothetical protein
MSHTQRTIRCVLGIAALLGLTAPAGAQFREAFRPEQRGVVQSVKGETITIAFAAGRDVARAEKTYTLAKNVEICTGGGFRLGGLYKEAKLAELAPGTVVGLVLTGENTVESIVAEEPTVRGILKGVDAKKNTLTVMAFAGREEAGEAKTYAVAADAEIAIDDGRGRRASIREGKLDELTAGAIVTLRLSLDKKRIHAVLAEGALLNGVVKAVDASKRSLTLVIRPGRGDDAGEERTIAVASEAVIVIDDGKGRRLSLREAKLADVPIGAAVTVKLAIDQSFVMLLKAEGPALFGLLKAVDADKRTITIAIPRGRDDAEAKTLTVAKDARVTFDGKDAKLADLKPGDNGPVVQLRLTLNQQAVQTVTAHQPRARE